MNDLSARLRAVCDLDLAEAREYSGRHEYDGAIQDLSPDGVRSSLAALAEAAKSGDPLEDAHDEAHLAAFEDRARVVYGELELYRRNPLIHLGALDLACYDRDYAPEADRDQARLAQLAAWPQAVDAAVAALDRVSAPVATALAAGTRGLVSGIPAGAPTELAAAAQAAHARLVAHIEQAAASGDPDPALGGQALAAMMSSSDRIEVDLGRLAEEADAERDRLAARLAESCARIDPGQAGPGGGPGTGPRPPGPGRGAGRGAALDRAGDRVHQGARPGALSRRRVPGRAGAGVAALGDGDDVAGRAGRARRAVLVLHHPAGPVLAAAGAGGLAGGLQRDHAARHHRARGRAGALLARPGAAARAHRRSGGRCTPARSSRAGRTTPRNCASRRDSRPTTPGSRSAYGWRRWSGSPGSPARSACTRRA